MCPQQPELATTASKPDEPPVTFPDGGLQAWMNIAGCTLISLTAFGKLSTPTATALRLSRIPSSARSSKCVRCIPNILRRKSAALVHCVRYFMDRQRADCSVVCLWTSARKSV